MVDGMSFAKKAFDFSNDSAEVIKSSFGPNGLDCMISTTSGALLVTNDGFQLLKSVSSCSPLARLMFDSLRLFYQKTGDFSKKYFLLIRELLFEALNIVPGTEEIPQQRLIAISNGMDVLLCSFFPNILKDLSDLGIVEQLSEEMHGIDRTILSIISTSVNGKFSPKACEDLANLLRKVLFENETSSCISDLKSRTEMLLNSFPEIFWEVPGLPLSSSVILSGIVIPQRFLTMLRQLPKKSTNKAFKFVILGASLAYGLPQNRTVLTLKDSQQVKGMLKWRARHIESILKHLSCHGVELILSSVALPETVVHFCNQFRLAAVQLVAQEDMTRICKVFDISPMFEVDLEQDPSCFVGEASCAGPIIVGQHTYVYLEPSKAGTKQVLLHAPSETMCRQYSVALQNSLKGLTSIFQEQHEGSQTPCVVPGGGTFELALAFALERYRKENKVESNVEMACRVLEKALMCVPRQLVENSGKKLPVCFVRAKANEALSSGKQLFALDKNGALCDVKKEGVFEPLMGNYWMISSVIQLFTQILRTDKIIHVKALPVNDLYDGDSADSESCSKDEDEDEGDDECSE